MALPEIIYLQTHTACNGSCRYCPHQDIYGKRKPRKMLHRVYMDIINWMAGQNYKGRLGFLLHYEPTCDPDLWWRLRYARHNLPGVKMEIATNGILPVEDKWDVVDRIAAGSRIEANSRAGNVRACPEIANRKRLVEPPCNVPVETMPITVDGDVILCCQDWRHETIVGNYKDLTAARERQLFYAEKAKKQELEICRDCMAGKTSEEVGKRLGRRFIQQP